MKNIGFPISHKENEKRRAVVPADIKRIHHPDCLFFEKGYGEVLGIADSEYEATGAHFVPRSEVLQKDIICDPKVGDADYLGNLHDQTVFGWIHAVQNKDVTDKLIAGKLTCYAWEDMFESGRHVFYRNNELAGEAAIMHAFQCYGKMPYTTEVALLGRGNVANGALKLLTMLGANVTQYNRKTEKLFQDELERYDVIVNAILWDTSRTDHVVYKKDLARMKKGALIIDISCDRNGGIETSVPTTIESPTYISEGVMHYVVDHTPSLFFQTVSFEVSKAVTPYLDFLIVGEENNVLQSACCVEKGVILDNRINIFQHRNDALEN